MPFTTVFNAKGLEVFGKYKFQKFSVLAGYNLYLLETKSIDEVSAQYALDSGFKKNDIIIGLSYFPFKFAQIYSEQRFSMGKHQREKEKRVFSL